MFSSSAGLLGGDADREAKAAMDALVALVRAAIDT